jgi:hypothetical protein
MSQPSTRLVDTTTDLESSQRQSRNYRESDELASPPEGAEGRARQKNENHLQVRGVSVTSDSDAVCLSSREHR